MVDPTLEQSDRAVAIATAWYQSLAENGELPLSAGAVQAELINLTRQIVALSSEDQFQIEAARAIGERLARLGYKRVDVIGNAPAILSQHLTQGLDPSQINMIHNRLGNVLTQVIAGFLDQQHQTTLVEKERALQAYEAELKNNYSVRQELEQRSLAILNALPDSLGIIKLDGEVIYYQAGSQRGFNQSDKVVFKHIREYLPAEAADELLLVFRSVIDTGQAQTHEYVIAFENLGKRYFQDKIAPYAGDNVLVISRDITKQKQIEEDLRASEARYRSVVEAQTDLICRFNRQGVVSFVNDVGYRMFKEAAREIVGHNISEFMQDVDPEANLKAVAATFNLSPQNPSLSKELQVYGPGQQIMVLEATTKALFNDQGEALEYQTTARDITALKRIEAALRESEERYRSVVEIQNEAIGRFTPDGIITFVNKAGLRLMGGTAEAIIGQNIFEFVPDLSLELAQGATAYSDLLTPQNPSVTRELSVARSDGEFRQIEVVTQAIFNDQEVIVEFQTTGRDITDLKLAQAALERQNEMLRQLSEQLINIQEVERQRIARDLHDCVLNELGAMMIAPAETLTPTVVRGKYEQLIDQLRQTINGLRSPMLNYGLYAALDDLSDSMMDNHQFDGVFSMDVPASLARFDLNAELHLFRIIQQACDNALQHAQACHIRIYGEIGECSVNLTVEDDGVGFQLVIETELAQVLAQKHFGLVSMLERGNLISADVQIISHPGAGTKVHVLWEPKKD